MPILIKTLMYKATLNQSYKKHVIHTIEQVYTLLELLEYLYHEYKTVCNTTFIIKR